MGRHPRVTEKIDRAVIDFINPVGAFLPDPFFDSYNEELLLSHTIIDLMALCDGPSVNITFDIKFLKDILLSHIKHIRRKILANGNGH